MCIIKKIESNESFWNFWNKETHLEFLSLLKRKRKILKFFELYFENYCIIGKIEGTVEVCLESFWNFWNFWNKEIHFEFLSLLKKKREVWNFGIVFWKLCIIGKTESTVEIFGIDRPKIRVPLLVGKKKKGFEIFWILFWKLCIIEENFWNFWNKEAHLEFLSLLERKGRFWNFSNCILKIIVLLEKLRAVEDFWNFWNKERHLKFLFGKKKEGFKILEIIVLLEKLRAVENF